MKKILLLLLVFVSAIAEGQVFQKPVGYGFEYRRLITDTLFAFPGDTFAIATNLKQFRWAAIKGDSLYLWSPSQDKWILNSGGGGGGGGTGTVTSISQAYGLIATPNPITTTGNIKFDSATVFPQLRATIPTNTDSLFGVQDIAAAQNRTFNFKETYNFTYDSVKTVTWQRRNDYATFNFGPVNKVIDLQVTADDGSDYADVYAIRSATRVESGLATSGYNGNMYTYVKSTPTSQKHQVGNFFNSGGLWIDQRLEMENDHTNGGTHWEVYREKWTQPAATYNFVSGKIRIDSLGVSLQTTKGLLGAGYKGLRVDSISNIIFENYTSSATKAYDSTNYKPLTVDANGKVFRFNHWPSGGGSGGVTQDYVDTTFIKVANYTADQKRGNVLGTIYEELGFANTDTFTVIGGTYNVVNNMIVDSVGASGCGYSCGVKLNYTTMLERWTIVSGFKVGDKTGTSYGVQIGIMSSNSTYSQNLMGRINLRNAAPYDGRLDLVDGQYNDNILSSSASNISFSVGDSIELTLNRNVNVFTLIARNVTTGAAEISVTYIYQGFTTAVNTGNPTWAVTGGVDSLYYFKFYSDESVRTKLLNIGDSKMTWYGNNVTQRIPNLMYQQYGDVISQSGSGNKTAEAVSTLDESILLQPVQALVTVGSNDIRTGVSSGTWQANLDTIYNKLTRNGIDVYFSLMYETAVDQSALISYLQLTYPTKFILDGYTATQNCSSCLLSDNIHLTAYGNVKWLDATAQSGAIDFMSLFRQMKFTAGDASYTAVGDSVIVNRYFNNFNKLNVFREGLLQWEADQYESSSITRSADTVFFHPPLGANERIVIQTSPIAKWTTIQPTEPYLLTDFPSAARGYSFRKLSSSYSGNCIRVRRSSDNAESNIGFVNNVLDTASLKTFVGANSAYVTTWYDQSGYGENATQTTSANQPRIMNAGVIGRVQNNDGDWVVSLYFDGTNDVLQYTGVQNNSVDWYLFQVCKRVSTSTIGSFIGSTGNGSQIFYYSNDLLYIIRSTGGSLGYKNVSDATATFNLLAGGYPEYLLYKNGSSVSLSSESFLGASGAPTEFNALGIAGASFSNCYISEAIIYPNNQASNRAAIDLNINSFWKIY